MKELKATDKVTQKMTCDGAVSESLAKGEVERISSREPETELAASPEESANAALDFAARAAEHREAKHTKKQTKADKKAVRWGSAVRRRPSSRLQFSDEERADPMLKKPISRSDRAADKLDAAENAIPKKRIIRTERTFDEATGKGKTRLHFEETEKKPNGKLHRNPLSRPMQELKATAHSKIRQVEHENVGVEAGHRGELITERGVSYAGSRVRAAIRHRRTKPWRDAVKAEKASIKANAEYLYQKALHDDPVLAASNPVSRFMQKQRIKRNYAKELRKTEKRTKNTAQTAKSAAKRTKEAVKETAAFVKRHWKVILIVAGIAMVVMLLIGGVSSCSMMFGSGSGTMMGSSYLSEDKDIFAAENAYLAMEAGTQNVLDRVSAYYPEYDEYEVSADEIGHDPYVLISILSAMHEGIFTYDEITDELAALFEKQYTLVTEVITETRYRTETREGTRSYTDPETGETVTETYTYEVEVPYSYYILRVSLTNKGLESLAAQVLDSEHLELFATYMATLGNREDLFPDSEYNKSR